VKIGIITSKKIITGKRKDADKSGIGIRIIGIAHFLSTVGSKTSSYQLLETTLSAMVIIDMMDQIDDIKMITGVLVGRLEEEHRFTIGWGQTQCA